MKGKECQACGGVYPPVQPDGLQYFHTCPTSIDPAIRVDENVTINGTTGKAVAKSPGKGAIDVVVAEEPAGVDPAE